MTRAILILALVLTIGCARFLAETDAPGALAAAQRFHAELKFAQALDEYRRFLKEHPASDWAPVARYGIALVHVSAENPKRSYAAALAEFEEFTTQYPKHARAEEARSWQQLLKSALESKKENERLNQNIERLKQLDVKQEEKRRRR